MLDEQGRILGVINVVDAFAVLLLLAVVSSGVTFLSGNEEPFERKQTVRVTVQSTGTQPYVADAIEPGPVGVGGVVNVENKSVEPTVTVVEDEDGALHERDHPRKKTVTLQVSLRVKTLKSGLLFKGRPLDIGQKVTLDFGTVRITGNVTRVPSEVRR